MWNELREWVVPLIAIGSFAWSAFTALRKNVVRPEDLVKFATTANLLDVNKVLQDQINEGDKAVVSVRHEVELVKKDVNSLPSHGTIQELRNTISDLAGAVRELKQEVKGLDGKVDDVRESVRAVDEAVRLLK